MDGKDLVTVDNLIFLAETTKAIGVAINESSEEEKIKVELWLPKSQIDRQTIHQKGDVGEIDIPRWLAEKNNLEYED